MLDRDYTSAHVAVPLAEVFIRGREIALVRSLDSRILVLRGVKVLLDSDLAELYAVDVKRLNEQVRRNSSRFPKDFLFQVSPEEYRILRSQNATSRLEHGGRRYLPHAFTEHGALMAANVLSSRRAIQMSVFVVRVFVRTREATVIRHHLAEPERRISKHDAQIQDVIHTLRVLMTPAPANRRRIGFQLPAGRLGPEALTKSRNVLKLRRPPARSA